MGEYLDSLRTNVKSKWKLLQYYFGPLGTQPIYSCRRGVEPRSILSLCSGDNKAVSGSTWLPIYISFIVCLTNGSKSSLANLMHFLSGIWSSFWSTDKQRKKSYLEAIKSGISATTGISRKNWPIQYLSAPLFTGAPKAAYFQALIDKIRKRIADCSLKGEKSSCCRQCSALFLSISYQL